jgi:hypothetical protein
MRFLKYLSLVALLALVSSPWATQKKLPLTLKKYGSQYYLQWTGTNFVTLTADTVSLYQDTTNSYANDPVRLLYDKKVNLDRENVNPGERFPEKLCMSVVGRSDADSSAIAWDMFYGASRSATTYLTGASATATYPGTTNIGQVGTFAYEPGLFFVPKMRITTATDSLVIQRVQVWGCDD